MRCAESRSAIGSWRRLLRGRLALLRGVGSRRRLICGGLAFLGGAVLWHSVLAWPRWHSVLDKRHVLVERIVHRQVALCDRVGATGFVLVDQLVHVRAHQVLGVLVDVLFVHLLTKDGCPAARATADANAQDKLEGRDDSHREAPTADGLAAQPRPEEASHKAVDQRADAADTGQAFDARNTPGSKSARLFGFRGVSLRFLAACCGGAATRAATAQDPIEDNHGTDNSAHDRVCCMRFAAAHPWNGRPCNAWQRRFGDLARQTAGSAGSPPSGCG